MNDNNLPIALFNGTIVTTNGLYRISDIDILTAKELVHQFGFISAIGHEATAHVLSKILDLHIPLNRVELAQEKTQLAIVFKLNKRPSEGAVLTEDELNNIGYKLKLMERLE